LRIKWEDCGKKSLIWNASSPKDLVFQKLAGERPRGVVHV